MPTTHPGTRAGGDCFPLALSRYKEVIMQLIQLGDCFEEIAKIPDESVDLIFTDPPYADRYLPLWESLAREGKRVLVPGGSLVTLYGVYRLPEIITLLSKHLSYYWCCALWHQQLGYFQKTNVRQTWKPVLWFVKEPQRVHHATLDDGVRPTGKEKQWYWQQQSESWAFHFIGSLVPKNGLVLDPFVGTGTTAVVCKKLGVNCIGFDNNPKQVEVALRRLL